MTQSNPPQQHLPAQVPAQGQGQDPVPIIYVQPTHAIPTNLMPPNPVGTTPVGQIDGYVVAKLGALMASMGAQQNAAADFMAAIQAIAIKTALEGATQLLAAQQKLNIAGLNALDQMVRNLPSQQMPVGQVQGSMSRFINGTYPVLTREYVDKEQVLALIAQAMLNPARIA